MPGTEMTPDPRTLARRRCAERGHKMRLVTRRGYRWPPESWSSVADAVTQQRKECRRWRCGAADEWETVSRRSVHSLSMPSDWWDILREEGVLWTPAP